jgi:hypothetical protein
MREREKRERERKHQRREGKRTRANELGALLLGSGTKC